jgi:nucleoid-associated protein YgaU
MKVRHFLSALLVLVLSFNFIAAQGSYSYNYEEMEMEEYAAELLKWQNREATAKEGIKDEEAKIEDLKKQLAEMDKEIDDTWAEIYQTMETDKDQYDSFSGDLNALAGEVGGFAALSPEDIYNRKADLADFEKRVEELAKNEKAATTQNQSALMRIRNQIAQAKSKMSNIAAGMYEVQRGDYLWKIAKKSEVYGDAFAWLRIYNSNKDKIKDPNLIYPAQVFSIPRIVGANEHLVTRGESLFKIAGLNTVYGNPFEWMKLYNANKDKIEDMNVIYPYQVLSIQR